MELVLQHFEAVPANENPAAPRILAVVVRIARNVAHVNKLQVRFFADFFQARSAERSGVGGALNC